MTTKQAVNRRQKSTNHPNSGRPSRSRKSSRRKSIRSITQEELARISKHQEAVRKYETLRADIIERMKEGAIVEPGDYQVELTRQRSRQLTKYELTRLLGEREVKHLLDLIPPSFCDRLKVTRRNTSPT